MVLYLVAESLAAIGFHFWILLPVWLAFAVMAFRSATTRGQRSTARWLVFSVVLWILFTVPLFFFFTLFGWFVLAAGIVAMVLAPLVVHKFAAALPVTTGMVAANLRLGRLTGVAVPAVVVLSEALASLVARNPEVGVFARGGLSAVALGLAVISGASFFQSVWSRSSSVRS